MAAPIRRALGARNQCNRRESRVVLGRTPDLAALRTNMTGQNPLAHRSGAAVFTIRLQPPVLTWLVRRFPAGLIDAGASTALPCPIGQTPTGFALPLPTTPTAGCGDKKRGAFEGHP